MAQSSHQSHGNQWWGIGTVYRWIYELFDCWRRMGYLGKRGIREHASSLLSSSLCQCILLCLALPVVSGYTYQIEFSSWIHIYYVTLYRYHHPTNLFPKSNAQLSHNSSVLPSTDGITVTVTCHHSNPVSKSYPTTVITISQILSQRLTHDFSILGNSLMGLLQQNKSVKWASQLLWWHRCW